MRLGDTRLLISRMGMFSSLPESQKHFYSSSLGKEHFAMNSPNEFRKKWSTFPKLDVTFSRSDGLIGCALQRESSSYLARICFERFLNHKSTFTVRVWEFSDRERFLGNFCTLCRMPPQLSRTSPHFHALPRKFWENSGKFYADSQTRCDVFVI